MKSENLLDAIGFLDDDLIEETDLTRKRNRKQKRWFRWGTLAACCCIVISVVFLYENQMQNRRQFQKTVSFETALEDETKNWETVHYECALGDLSLKLPEDWEYSISKYNKKEKTFGIEFWPKDAKEGKINLSYWDMFAVCGTELDQKKIKLDNGMKAWMGTYDNHSYWDFIHFTNEYEHYVVTTECEDEWWQKYEDQVMKILNTIEITSDSK